MHITKLRKVGGSVMLAVPPALLELLQLRPGVNVGMSVQGGRLIVEPEQRPRYTINELLAQCDPETAPGKEDREWLRGEAAGGELI